MGTQRASGFGLRVSSNELVLKPEIFNLLFQRSVSLPSLWTMTLRGIKLRLQ